MRSVSIAVDLKFGFLLVFVLLLEKKMNKSSLEDPALLTIDYLSPGNELLSNMK